MLFISGPRQVGKTTSSLAILPERSSHYFNWDVQTDRTAILQGQRELGRKLGVSPNQWIVFDELHKYSDWKNFLKGLYDVYHKLTHKIIVTGSARLDTYRKGGDSLLGRYFHIQMFPLSPAEFVRTDFSGNTIQPPEQLDDERWNTLLEMGGFPEPFLKNNKRFHRQWSRSRQDRLFQEDIRSLGSMVDLSKIELLAELIRLNASTSLNYSSYAKRIRSSVETIQRWITLLNQLSYCFTIRPWSRNISRSLTKEPKVYLYDWSTIENYGQRNENFIASCLLKAVETWNDTGLGDYGLYYLRTKDKKEIDFVITRGQSPWILIEVKTSQNEITPSLQYFQKATQAPYAFQLVINRPYEAIDCFSYPNIPIVVPAKTFLSQLV